MSKTMKPDLLRATIGLVGFIILLTGTPTQAATINVTTAADDNFEINNGKCSLREAVHVIYVGQDVFGCKNARSASGTLDPYGTNDTINIPGFTIRLSYFAGPIQITSGVTIRGAGNSRTFIDGSNLSMMDSPIEIDNGGQTAYAFISDLTIQKSPATGVTIDPNASLFLSNVHIMNTGTSMQIFGGCINNDAGSVVLSASELKGCKGDPGGIQNVNSGMLYVLNTTIHECIGNVAGGIYNRGAFVAIYDSTLANNVATAGAGFFNDEGGTAYLQGVTIAYNENTQGLNFSTPAAALLSNSPTTSLTIQDSIVANNTAPNVDQQWKNKPNCGIEDTNGALTIVSNGYNILGNPGDDICPGEVTSGPNMDHHVDPKFVTNAGKYPFPDGSKLPRPSGVGPAYVPAAGSPALSVVPSSDPFCSTQDERFVNRSKGNGNCDIGAVTRR